MEGMKEGRKERTNERANESTHAGTNEMKTLTVVDSESHSL